MNIFQQRAAARNADKFSNVTPQQQNQPETEVTLAEEEITTPKQNIFQQHAAKNAQKEANKFGFWDTVKDVREQLDVKSLAGLGGAYGNILESVGLQPKAGQSLPGQTENNNQQLQVYEKIDRGEIPSIGELMLLSDDEALPRNARFPTSEDINKGIEKLTGLGEGKTPLGRIAGRGAQFLGEGAATGSGIKGLIGLGASGIAGQGIREAGGPEFAANATEILGPLATSAVQGKLNPSTLSRSGQETQRVIDAGRKIGLTEKQITPLIQGEGKAATLSKIAKKDVKTKELFSSIKEKLGDSYSAIKSSKDAKVKLPNSQQVNLRKEFGQIRNDLSKTLAPSPEKEAALNYIEKSLESLRSADITPEYLVNFWQDINKSVKWNSISGGKKALAQLKKPISETLERVSPQLAKDFEMTNDLYSKYAQISKKLRPDIVDAFLNKGEMIATVPAGFAFVTGNPWPLIGLGTESAVRILGREMLISPYFQNIGSKLVKNFNEGSQIGVTNLVKQAREYMERKYPEEKWNFLTDFEN